MNKFTKRVLPILLAAFMMMSLAACGDNKTTTTTPTPSTSTPNSVTDDKSNTENEDTSSEELKENEDATDELDLDSIEYEYDSSSPVGYYKMTNVKYVAEVEDEYAAEDEDTNIEDTNIEDAAEDVEADDTEDTNIEDLEDTEDIDIEETAEDEFDGLLGIQVFLVMNDDNTGYIEAFGEKSEFTWDDTTMTPLNEDDEPNEYTYNSDIITMLSDEGAIEFLRLNEVEYIDYILNESRSAEDYLTNLFGDIGEFTDTYDIDLSSIPIGDPSEEQVEISYPGSKLSILGADNVALVRVWFEFTNTSEDRASSSDNYGIRAVQDEEYLENHYNFSDTWIGIDPSYEYEDILPDHTIRFTKDFGYDPNGGIIILLVTNYNYIDGSENGVDYYYIDPQNIDLVGAPEDTFEIKLDPDSVSMFEDLESSDENVEFVKYEIVDGLGEDKVLRVYCNYTNNSNNIGAMFFDYSTRAFQDGYDLLYGTPDISSSSDEAAYEDVNPGETILLSKTYNLRTKSPVAFIFYKDSAPDDLYGVVIDVTES